jgi:hypothetical protein
MKAGGNAQDRRRTRRAALRREERGLKNAPTPTPEATLVVVTELSDEQRADMARLVAQLGSDASEDFGGKPNPGTDKDKRLKENKADVENPEDLALDVLDAYQPDESAQQAQEFALALLAAAGDVAWGPEEGLVDLLCDINAVLADAQGAVVRLPGDDEACGCCGDYAYAVDVSVKLDKALVCVGVYDVGVSYWVVPIAIDANGEPAVAPRDQWVPVEQGWVEVAPGEADGEALQAAGLTSRAAGELRFVLKDFSFASAVEDAIPAEHKPGERVPARRASPTVTEPQADESSVAGSLEWTALFVPEASLTDDGRAFAPGSLTWRDLPLSLAAMTETSEGGHIGAEVAGRIDRIWRDGNDIKASGVFAETDYGQMIAGMVGRGELRGLSVDTAIHEYEVGPRADYFDADGAWLAERPDREETDSLDILFGEDDDRIFVVTAAVIGMATVCPFPAFAVANISLVASGAVWRYSHQGGFVVVQGEPVLVAAAVDAPEEIAADGMPAVGDADLEPELTAAAAGIAPARPPAEWFSDPALEELTPLTVTDDGRVYGHAWGWDTCHLSFEGCVVAPHSKASYAYYRLGEVECSEGERVAVGKVTIDTGHAGQRLSRAQAISHYDDTGTVAAYVAFGEDEHGGWFAGAIRPELTEDKVRLLRGSTLSGDWRGVDGNLELIALLAVNVPGFPVPRTRALVASGDDGERELLALTAAGVVRREATPEADELRAIAAEALEAA